jgi:Cdc6-like AAA superfamily ATPase
MPRSRLASSKLAFNAYQAAQLQEIVTSRLKSNNCEAVIQPVGVLYAARKVR